MKLLFQCLFLFYAITIFGCKISSPCNVLDSSCNPLSALVFEKIIKESRASLTFSLPGGTYKYDPFVSISTAMSPSVIRYSTDGSEPSCSSGTVYSAPVPLLGAKTHTLKAIVCSDNAVVNSRTEVYTVTISPLMAPNLRFWYSADSLGLAQGTEVTTWNDNSGNANHLYGRGAGAANPVFQANVLNGKPSIRFESAKQTFLTARTLSGYTGAKAGTGVLVLRKYSVQSEEIYFSIGNLAAPAGTRNWRGNLLTPSLCAAPSISSTCAGTATSQIPLTGYHVIVYTMDTAGAAQYFLDGVANGVGTLASPASFVVPNSMFVGTGVNLATFLDAEILELLFFEQGFDANGVNTVHCLIGSKYGLPIGTSCP